MSKEKDNAFFAVISFCTLLAVCLPYFLAARGGNGDYIFNGFLLNPLDGNSYLAKMYQGWQGEWRFHLPFTPEPGNGAYIFLFYIALGHLGRITGLSLLSIFHTARILGSLAMLWSLWEFYKVVLPTQWSRRLAFVASSMGSGMGWLVINRGLITSDFWISEAYPFLSAYANPHFPLGLSLILGLMIIWLKSKPRWELILLTLLLAFGLSIINPFGIVILVMVFSGSLLWKFSQKAETKPMLIGLMTISLAGLPCLIYDYLVANTDPILRIWNEQNVTPSPPIWDLILSMSPALLMSIWGLVSIVKEIRRGKEPKGYILVVWVVLGITAVYLPLELQRRFMMGLFVPITGLAVQGLVSFAGENRIRTFASISIFFLLMIPSNLITLLAALNGIQSHHPKIFLTEEEMAVLDWIEENTRPESIVLSSPEMGLFIPAYTGRRVIYGHPFESVNATEAEKVVLDFYSGQFEEMEINKLIDDYQVELVMVGPRERSLGDVSFPAGWVEQYSQGEISLFDP